MKTAIIKMLNIITVRVSGAEQKRFYVSNDVESDYIREYKANFNLCNPESYTDGERSKAGRYFKSKGKQ
jgi:hypothetical protein